MQNVHTTSEPSFASSSFIEESELISRLTEMAVEGSAEDPELMLRGQHETLDCHSFALWVLRQSGVTGLPLFDIAKTHSWNPAKSELVDRENERYCAFFRRLEEQAKERIEVPTQDFKPVELARTIATNLSDGSLPRASRLLEIFRVADVDVNDRFFHSIILLGVTEDRQDVLVAHRPNQGSPPRVTRLSTALADCKAMLKLGGVNKAAICLTETPLDDQTVHPLTPRDAAKDFKMGMEKASDFQAMLQMIQRIDQQTFTEIGIPAVIHAALNQALDPNRNQTSQLWLLGLANRMNQVWHELERPLQQAAQQALVKVGLWLADASQETTQPKLIAELRDIIRPEATHPGQIKIPYTEHTLGDLLGTEKIEATISAIASILPEWIRHLEEPM